MIFFNDIWLKVGEHEYIYIFEMKTLVEEVRNLHNTTFEK